MKRKEQKRGRLGAMLIYIGMEDWTENRERFPSTINRLNRK